MATAADRLAQALCAATNDGDPAALVALAREAGVHGRLARRAAKGIATNADAYLKLCHALAISPLTGEAFPSTTPVKVLPDLDWALVSIVVCNHLIGLPHEPARPKIVQRKAAKAWGIALVALARMKAGERVGIDNLLKLCAALNRHPHEFLTRTPAVFHGKQPVEHIEIAGVAS